MLQEGQALQGMPEAGEVSRQALGNARVLAAAHTNDLHYRNDFPIAADNPVPALRRCIGGGLE